MLLLDVTPLSLGIEALGGVVAKIIHRNSTIPASATEHFTTGVEGQTNVAIHVLQGERELAKDSRSLARFDLKGIPPMPAGLPRIEVKFLIDANGILHVSAREARSGKEAEIEVQPSYGLTDEQVENMILESFDNAEEDFRQRQVIEARNEAENILTALGKGPQQSCVGATDVAGAHRHRQAWKQRCERCCKQDDYQAIRDRHRCLNQGTMRLAELMMDSAVASALKGKTWTPPMSAKARQHRIPSRRQRLSGNESTEINLWQTKKHKAADGHGRGSRREHGEGHLPAREQDVRVRTRQAAATRSMASRNRFSTSP